MFFRALAALVTADAIDRAMRARQQRMLYPTYGPPPTGAVSSAPVTAVAGNETDGERRPAPDGAVTSGS